MSHSHLSVLDINEEVFRYVYRNLLVACEGGPQEEELHQYSVTQGKSYNVVLNSGRKLSVFSSYWKTGKLVFSLLFSLIFKGSFARLTQCHTVKAPTKII